MAKANRSDADEAAVISKDITPTLNAAKRQITGAGDTEGEVVFYIRSADKPYYYGIRVLLSTGLVDTIEWGTLTFKYAIVQATRRVDTAHFNSQLSLRAAKAGGPPFSATRWLAPVGRFYTDGDVGRVEVPASEVNLCDTGRTDLVVQGRLVGTQCASSNDRRGTCWCARRSMMQRGWWNATASR